METKQETLSGPSGSVIVELVPPERLNFIIDGVYAIVMTLLVLDLKPPEGSTAQEALLHLDALGPKVLAFIVGFAVVGSGWAFVHQLAALFTRSNLLHVGLNLIALLFASLIPFSASVMGSFPHSAYGPAAYSLNVGILTLIYALDLSLCQRTLIPPSVDRRLIWIISTLAICAGAWCLFAGLVIAPLYPDLALWALGIHFLGHWACLFLTEREVRHAAALANQWHAEQAAAQET